MKQIKTIARQYTNCFDDKVNEAIADGWELVKRYYTPDKYFVAELEREIITEAERCCENCAHFSLGADREPCFSCSETCSEWEPVK